MGRGIGNRKQAVELRCNGTKVLVNPKPTLRDIRERIVHDGFAKFVKFDGIIMMLHGDATEATAMAIIKTYTISASHCLFLLVQDATTGRLQLKIRANGATPASVMRERIMSDPRIEPLKGEIDFLDCSAGRTLCATCPWRGKKD